MDGNYTAFELDVAAALGAKLRADTDLAVKLWSALANIIWCHAVHGEVGYSFRQAGGLVAELRADGSGYLDWYCCGPHAQVAPEIAAPLAEHGWSWRRYRR